MLNTKQRKIIDAWTDGYQYLFLLSILAKIFLLNLIVSSKSFNLLSIAKALKFDHEMLQRIFYGLEAMGLCYQSQGKFYLTELAESFLEDQSAILKVIIASDRWAPKWFNSDNPKKIESPIKKALNNYYKTSDYINILLHEWFSVESKKFSSDIISKINLKNVSSVAEVGGGSGQIVQSILKKNKKMHGVIFDKIYQYKNISNATTNYDFEKRLLRVGCDFFKKIHIDAELIFMKSVLHNWNDKNALKIIKNLCISMPPDSKLIIIERVLHKYDNDTPSHDMAFLDLRMHMLHDGKERSLNELIDLIEIGGFNLNKKIETKNGFYILEAVKRN
jgi:predicted transcriptional regulator/phospholipid N-methyltransferase